MNLPPTIIVGSLSDETYHYEIPEHGLIIWNVTTAKRLVQSGHVLTTIGIEPAEMKNIAERNAWDPERLDKVDPADPGIAAPFVWERRVIYVLIDGNHRNARALRDGLPFRAHLLTEDAARLCVLMAPPGLMPWG